MKSTIAYKYFLFVILMLSITFISTYIWQGDSSVYSLTQIEEKNNNPDSNESYLKNFEATVNFLGISRLQARQYNQTVKIDSSHYLFRLSCASHLTTQQFCTTKSSYKSFYSKKELQGYYVFALCKLLI